MKLNPQQRKAIEYISGPCLVLAGAGSGKTRVITQKIVHLIRHCDYDSKQIYALTFTNKAAREMKERVNKALEKGEARGLQVSTFHTFGLNFIRRECVALGLKPGFTLFDDQDQAALIKELAPNKQIEKDDLAQIVRSISDWKSNLVSPVQALREARDQHTASDAKYYEQYQRYLRAYNAVDFEDLIALPCGLLASNEKIRNTWQNRVRYLLVDEYQDTNTSQYELIKWLIGERARFTVVGDDDQSIYAWRGANPENLHHLKRDYPRLNVVKLEQNYRSKQRILRCANHLIANNPHLFEKKLFSAMDEDEHIRVLSAKNETSEANLIVSEILTQSLTTGPIMVIMGFVPKQLSSA